MGTPLRIAVAASGLGHVARGIEAWAGDLAAELAARGERVTLYRGAGPASHPYERVAGCWTRESGLTAKLMGTLPARLRWRVGLGSGYGVEQVSFAASLVRELRRRPADVLHVQDPLVALLAQRARRLGLTRTRVVLAHGTEEPPAFLRRIEYVQHLAPWHLDRAKDAGAWRPTWTAIPNFIDTARFAPGPSGLRTELGIPASAVAVLAVAAIKRAHKRVDHLLAEFARVRAARPDAFLVVAGGWETDTDELVAEGSRRLGDRARFLPRFPRERIPDLYRAADVFAHGSLFEMMPIAVLEAVASGLPCVVHDHPVLRWMTGPGGVITNLAEPGALAGELIRLADDAGERRRLGALARDHARAAFEAGPVVDRILAYYRRVAAGRGVLGVR